MIGLLVKKIGLWAKVTLILAGMLLIAKTTDADLLDTETVPGHHLAALTLDLGVHDSANQSQKSVLFSVQGLVPSGYAVATVRVKNSGTLPLSYQLRSVQTAGDQILCAALQSRLFVNWKMISQTPLPQLNRDSVLEPDAIDDLLLSVELTDSNPSLQQTNCIFNLVLSAQLAQTAGAIHFVDEEVLQNQVAAGAWSN